MDNFRNFLESSTIHGLAYISTTRKCVRLSWIFVVIAGFVGSGIIIYESFETWAESPVKTTIETLPIEQIKFPKVTVCPPENTFTNLNYDIMSANNMTLSLYDRNELLRYALEQLSQSYYDEVLKNMSILEEEHRYYNWYNGYSEVGIPYNQPYNWGGDHNLLTYDIKTSATEGAVVSRHFGENYDPDKLERFLSSDIEIQVPHSLKRMVNASLIFSIEKVSMVDIAPLESEEFYNIDNDRLSTTISNATKNIEMRHASAYLFGFRRTISDGDFERTRNNLLKMPGFKLSWRYNVSVKPQQKFSDDILTKSYVRYISE